MSLSENLEAIFTTGIAGYPLVQQEPVSLTKVLSVALPAIAATAYLAYKMGSGLSFGSLALRAALILGTAAVERSNEEISQEIAEFANSTANASARGSSHLNYTRMRGMATGICLGTLCGLDTAAKPTEALFRSCLYGLEAGFLPRYMMGDSIPDLGRKGTMIALNAIAVVLGTGERLFGSVRNVFRPSPKELIEIDLQHVPTE